jgi:hypothetical protein
MTVDRLCKGMAIRWGSRLMKQPLFHEPLKNPKTREARKQFSQIAYRFSRTGDDLFACSENGFSQTKFFSSIAASRALAKRAPCGFICRSRENVTKRDVFGGISCHSLAFRTANIATLPS